jgi:3-oxoacyl-[acyl-carrier-protein] synthase-3
MSASSLNFDIRGIAATVPRQKVRLADLTDEFGDTDITRITKTTGIETVRVAPDDVCASDMAELAAEELLASLDFDRADIGGLIFASHTPDYLMPATSCLLQDRLGLRNNLAAFDIPYSCSAFVYSVIQAGLLINGGMADHVLVLVGDTMVRQTNPADRALRMVLGDGSAAALISRGDHQADVRAFTDGSGAKSLIIPAGGARKPRSEETAEVDTDDDGNGRSADNLYMDGTAILRFAVDRVPAMVDDLLATRGWSKDDLEYVFFHQANGFIVDYLRRKMKLTHEQVPVHLRDFGNTGPASIPLAICEQLADADTMPERIVLAGFGVGLSWAGIATTLRECRVLPRIEM